ncbi:hypothetical protein K3175_05510 [Qipengyuania sp. GH1]|uniref:hypothetical protein n=1 Tax=Qipengyuania aestuarii TaxID=2867241 RepID=UPI001C88B87C|nr:hypothetical protein [Qipengyuania aestuarii]MBX7535110.1 hypothetical protein [Qipengyuania aestuarii]
MMKNLPLCSALPVALLALAGCTAADETTSQDDETMIPVEPDGGIGDGAEPLPETEQETIPRALHGRWGLAPGDCTDEDGDAKGALEISATKLRFYESQAAIAEIKEKGDDNIRAIFDFAGEGQNWQREINLHLNESSTRLIREEYGEDAMSDPLTYTKCPV